MTTIPADLFVSEAPSVVSTGGDGLVLNGLLLTISTRVPLGTVMEFPSPQAVEDFFGGTSSEAKFAGGGVNLGTGYFGGYTGATQTPGSLLVTQYNTAPVSAYLRGGDVSGLTLTQLQAFNGTLTVNIDATPATASVNLSGVTSFTNAAQLIEQDLAISGASAATFTGGITGNVLTASSVTGVISVGDKVTGAGVTAGTFITSLGTGTGGAGTYNLTTTAGSPIANEAMIALLPAVQFDSISGAFVINSGTTGADSTIAFATGAMATDLMLTQALGAVLSQGAIAAVPGTFMDNVVSNNRNWASFATNFDPDNGSGFANKFAFSTWTDSKNDKYVYAAWDPDPNVLTENPASGSYGAAVAAAGLSGTALLTESLGDQNLAAFVCGTIASINFDQEGGRIAFAYRKQAGLVPGVSTETGFVNACGNPQVEGDRGNGYNCYAAIATANQNFTDFQRGFISGPFMWLDTYVNQIAMNADFQLALMELQENSNSIPFNTAGDSQVESALADTIEKYEDFGAVVAGVTLSASQIQRVNALAGGLNIAPTITSQGWYLYIPAASPATRQARGPRQLTFFYADGESVQSFSFSSVVAL